MSEGLKKCPYCAETIQIEAIKCKHCGEMIDEKSDFWSNEKKPIQLIRNSNSASPGVAAVLSFFFPGVGQIYRGKLAKGILWLVAVVIGYMFMVFPGVVLHIICVFNAYESD